jgi:segregation and condensation protein A
VFIVKAMVYELKLDKFTGPLDKLLELIEAKQLQIAEISLAQVTDDFLRYLKQLSGGGTDLRLVADFISVASRLILIKSKYLLPDLSLTSEEEAEIKDLEKRLKIYQELRPTLKILARLWRGGGCEFSRPYFLTRGVVSDARGPLIFYPGKKMKLEILFEQVSRIFESLQVFELETKTIKDKIVSVEEKIEEIIARIKKGGETKFAKLSRAKPRSEIIAIFLAILHLAREQLILLEQKERFSDIIIKDFNPKNPRLRQAGEFNPNAPNY